MEEESEAKNISSHKVRAIATEKIRDVQKTGLFLDKKFKNDILWSIVKQSKGNERCNLPNIREEN